MGEDKGGGDIGFVSHPYPNLSPSRGKESIEDICELLNGRLSSTPAHLQF
jgi:hypothetical protein